MTGPYVCLQCNRRLVRLIFDGLAGHTEAVCSWCGLRLQTSGKVEIEEEDGA